MLEYLKDKKDVGFFLSVQALMQTCWSVNSHCGGVEVKGGGGGSQSDS